MARPDPIGTLPERPPEVGELVQVRSRRWLVEEVSPSETPGRSPLVTLACADDDAQGQALRVYWDYEIDRRILEEEGWEHLAERGFDDTRRFAAFLHTLRWHCVTATDSNLFQAPFRAGIRIDAYQMEPLRKALRLPRVNLFIADDTGLGKTIEAGLIARELLLRRKAKTIVVAAPPSVLEQWRGELEDRFGLVFEILDRAYLTRMRRERGFGVNPWMTHSRFLVSHNLLIDPGYADPMRAWLGPLRPGSLLILDEAHHAAPSSGGRYGIESKFTRAVRDLAGRFEHRLFLSATPHNGHSNSFSTLLELLDPYRFTRGVKVRGRKALEDVMVRRLKEDIRVTQGGFPERRVERVVIDGLPADAPELANCRGYSTNTARPASGGMPTPRGRPRPRRACSSWACSSGCSRRSRRSRAAWRCTGGRSSATGNGSRPRSLKVRRPVGPRRRSSPGPLGARRALGPQRRASPPRRRPRRLRTMSSSSSWFRRPPTTSAASRTRSSPRPRKKRRSRPSPRRPSRARPIAARNKRSCGGESRRCSTACRLSPSGPATCPGREDPPARRLDPRADVP